jgi:uncharacterized protein (TIGR03437 family)
MKKLPVAALLCVISSTLFAQQLRVVNAASLSEVTIAPGSIITIFGTKLAQGVASAADSAKPPATLGGVTVSIGGAAASLFYVSPTQINAVVNSATPLGSEAVVVTSASGTQNGTVTVGNDGPPGLFSLFGSGTRDGAILNAITFLLGDFSTRTAGSSTYLALFATGLTGTPTVTIGGVPVTVSFSGAAPCCVGLQQINVMLPDSLAGAGRVPVVATVNGHASNTVEVVLLPPATAKQFSNDQENETRSRELAALATIPNTSLALSTDQNDDVVRVIDLRAKTVAHVIALPRGANPVGVSVTADGAFAVVAESGTGKVAIVDLKTFTVKSEIAAGEGASSVAVVGTQAVVVNRDADTVTIVDLTAATAQKTLTVGRGPANVAADAATHTAYVTNENEGSISVINLGTLAVTKTIALGPSVRPSGITLLPGTAVAFVTAPGNGPDGALYTVNLTAGTSTSMAANPDRSGGSTDLAYFNGKLYLANQAGGSISVLPVNATTGAATGAVTTIKVDLGARSLAIDAKDGWLVVSNEGTGTLVVVSLTSNAVIGRIDAVRSSSDDNDDHSDRGKATNLPVILTVAPATGKAGTTFAIAITGTNFTGATGLSFGNGNGNGSGNGKGNDRGDDFTVKNVAVNSAGTQLTATVSIDSSAKPGAREIKITTPNGESTDKGVGAAIFMVIP